MKLNEYATLGGPKRCCVVLICIAKWRFVFMLCRRMALFQLQTPLSIDPMIIWSPTIWQMIRRLTTTNIAVASLQMPVHEKLLSRLSTPIHPWPYGLHAGSLLHLQTLESVHLGYQFDLACLEVVILLVNIIAKTVLPMVFALGCPFTSLKS